MCSACPVSLNSKIWQDSCLPRNPGCHLALHSHKRLVLTWTMTSLQRSIWLGRTCTRKMPLHGPRQAWTRTPAGSRRRRRTQKVIVTARVPIPLVRSPPGARQRVPPICSRRMPTPTITTPTVTMKTMVKMGTTKMKMKMKTTLRGRTRAPIPSSGAVPGMRQRGEATTPPRRRLR